MKSAVFVLSLIVSVPALAQVTSRPTDAPIVTAENESWYRLREPLVFAGEFYYPAGAVVFFNGDVMARTGHYNGVPLYADTTLEPYSIVFVPVGRGLMQPYERLRTGELSGTSGSRAASFPGSSERFLREIAVAAGAPTNAPLPLGAISAFTPEATSASERPVPLAAAAAPSFPAEGTAGAPRMTAAERLASREKSREAISIEFKGDRWVNAGGAVRIDSMQVTQVGEYHGFPVYQETGRQDERIYLPTAAGWVAPFKPGR